MKYLKLFFPMRYWAENSIHDLQSIKLFAYQSMHEFDFIKIKACCFPVVPHSACV